jgi:ribosomal protein L9
MSGLYETLFSSPRKQRISAEEAQAKTAAQTNARLDQQQAEADATSRTQQEAINARRRAAFGRSGRRLLLTGAETGVTDTGLSTTLGG